MRTSGGTDELVPSRPARGSVSVVAEPVGIDSTSTVQQIEPFPPLFDDQDCVDQATQEAPATPATIALIPAHNEERDIAMAIRSVRDQVDEVVVIADNCSDGTASVAAAEGASVFTTRNNRAKKAGALNQALGAYLPDLDDEDYVVLMDADTAVCEGWVEIAKRHYTPAAGGISAAYLPRDIDGFIPLLQKVEYAQERRRIARRKGRVDVLSGTATILRVKILREVADKRGSVLAGERGWFYDESSLTEDFEITMALKQLGYRPRAPQDCVVETDLMPTWRALYAQRLRWQRGTLETLWSYLSLRALPLFFLQIWTYLRTFMWPLLVSMILIAAYYDVLTFRSWWLLILPIIAIEQIISTRRAGLVACIVAGFLIPVVLYDNFRSFVYWTALWKSLRKHTPTWIT